MSLPRRALLPLVLPLALPGLAPPARAQPGGVRFRVRREGREIGSHAVTLGAEDGAQVALSEVRVAVRVAGITVYRYAHHTRETWRDGRLAAMVSRVDRNGRVVEVSARLEGDGLAVTGPEGMARLPPGAAPLTWWRAASLDRPLFDPEDGRPLAPRIERAREGGGLLVRVTTDRPAEILYDSGLAWVGFSTTGDDGSAIAYERVAA